MNGPFRAAVICDGVFARREYPLLVRLEVGLADEGVRVAHAAPVQVLLDGVFGLYSEPVGYDDFAPGPLRGVRARNLNEGITHALKADSPAEIDVMHCCGGGAWEIAAEAATRAGAALLVEVWRAGMEQHVQRLMRRWRRLHIGLCTPDSRAVGGLRDRFAGTPVFHSPWGVFSSQAAARPWPDAGPITIGLIASGIGTDEIFAALRGITQIARERDVQVFAPAELRRRRQIWRGVASLGLLERFTFIPDVEQRRAPFLEVDLVVQPEARGERRSLLLDLMARGTPVVALADDQVEYLIDGRTCVAVREPEPAGWGASLRSVIDDAARRDALRASSVAYCKEHASVSAYVRAVGQAYTALRESLPSGAGEDAAA